MTLSPQSSKSLTNSIWSAVGIFSRSRSIRSSSSDGPSSSDMGMVVGSIGPRWAEGSRVSSASGGWSGLKIFLRRKRDNLWRPEPVNRGNAEVRWWITGMGRRAAVVTVDNSRRILAWVPHYNLRPTGMLVQEISHVIHLSLDHDPAVLFRVMLLHLVERDEFLARRLLGAREMVRGVREGIQVDPRGEERSEKRLEMSRGLFCPAWRDVKRGGRLGGRHSRRGRARRLRPWHSARPAAAPVVAHYAVSSTILAEVPNVVIAAVHEARLVVWTQTWCALWSGLVFRDGCGSTGPPETGPRRLMIW